MEIDARKLSSRLAKVVCCISVRGVWQMDPNCVAVDREGGLTPHGSVRVRMVEEMREVTSGSGNAVRGEDFVGSVPGFEHRRRAPRENDVGRL